MESGQVVMGNAIKQGAVPKAQMPHTHTTSNK